MMTTCRIISTRLPPFGAGILYGCCRWQHRVEPRSGNQEIASPTAHICGVQAQKVSRPSGHEPTKQREELRNKWCGGEDMHTTTNSTVNPLHHAGELLRCRAAPRSRTSEQMLSEISGNDKGGGDQNNPLESSTSFASQRPSLRAYSASLFLYSPSFPPYIYRNHKRDLMTRAGAEHDIVEAERQQPVGNMRTRYRIDDESSTCPMTATAKYTTVSASSDNLLPGRGYLHKYMGYAQEKITPFRAATKVSQKCCNYTGKHARDHNLTSSTGGCAIRDAHSLQMYAPHLYREVYILQM